MVHVLFELKFKHISKLFLTPFRFAISFCINFTLFGGCVVFLLLAANNINKFVEQVFPDVEITYCLILVILSAAVFPICLCGTPKDFW